MLTEGASLGQSISLDAEIVDELDGLTITGEISDSYGAPISVRVAPNEVGTYVIDARLGKVALDGIAKLESEPNHALLWHESGIYSASVSLFSIGGGLAVAVSFATLKARSPGRCNCNQNSRRSEAPMWCHWRVAVVRR